MTDNPTPWIAGLLALFFLWRFYSGSQVCAQCGGRGDHRRDCPFDRDEA